MLKRRWLLNLALFAVVLVLAVSARLEQRQDLLTTTLTSMPVQQIQSLSLKRPGEPRMRLARKDNGWHMLEPFVAPAADAPTTKLLPIAATYVHRTLPAATLDLQRLRLDPAMISLRLDDLELRFGTTEPVHDWRYVQIGDLVHLIDDGFLAQLLAPAQDYLDRRLLPKNFSPGLGNLDGRPIGAGVLAELTEVEAIRVEPLHGQLGGHVLTLESADGGKGIRFLIDAGGTRWSRLDQRLSYLFTDPPLAELDQLSQRNGTASRAPFSPSEPFAPPAAIDTASPVDRAQSYPPASDAQLLQLSPPSTVDTLELLPAPTTAPMPTTKLSP